MHAVSLVFIGRTNIALASYMYARKCYRWPWYDRTGNLPVKSEYIVPLLVSASEAKQNILHAEFLFLGGLISSLIVRSMGLGLIVLRFFIVLFKFPFIVAVEGGMCFCMASKVIPGIPKSWSLQITFVIIDVVGEIMY